MWPPSEGPPNHPPRDSNPYLSGAVKIFTQALSRELGSRGITVNNVQPGPDVDVDHAIHFLQPGLLERLRNGDARIVDKRIQSAERCDRLFDRALDSLDVGRIRLDRDSLSPFCSIAFATAEPALDILRV